MLQDVTALICTDNSCFSLVSTSVSLVLVVLPYIRVSFFWINFCLGVYFPSSLHFNIRLTYDIFFRIAVILFVMLIIHPGFFLSTFPDLFSRNFPCLSSNVIA